MHNAADDAHRPQLHGSAAARAATGTDRPTDGQTDRRRFNMLTAYAVLVKIKILTTVANRLFGHDPSREERQ